MKAAVWYGPYNIKIEDVPYPTLGVNDVIIKVKACGICGSDLESYEAGVFAKPGQIMGHEFSGEVVEVGRNVKNIEVGDRVTGIEIGSCGQCYWCKRNIPVCPERFNYTTGYGLPGALAEYVKIHNAYLNENVYKLPNKLTYEEGALTEPTSVGVSAVRIANPTKEDNVVILGAGTIGLCVMQVMKAIASKIIIIDLSTKRLEAAKELGADVIINASKENPLKKVIEVTGEGRWLFGTGGFADIVMDCVGTGETFKQAIDMVHTGGKIVLVGLGGYVKPALVNPSILIHKYINVLTCLGEDFPKALALLESGVVKVKPMISHEFLLEKVNEAFKLN
jgi:threonine dehydrogenase-like Zn-dependent dehydrogenase